MSCTRRRSPSLVAAVKDASRSPVSSFAAKHRFPWNKYGQGQNQELKVAATLTRPSKAEFLRIRQWSMQQRQFEERFLERARQRDAEEARREIEQREVATRQRQDRVVQEIQKRQEKREAQRKERSQTHERYLAFRRESRLTPLLYERRQSDFEEVCLQEWPLLHAVCAQALQRSESARLELYNSRVKPFRTMRPSQIQTTRILQELGKFAEIQEREIPFEMKSTGRVFVTSTLRKLPPPVLKPLQDAAPAEVGGGDDATEAQPTATVDDAATQTAQETPFQATESALAIEDIEPAQTPEAAIETQNTTANSEQSSDNTASEEDVVEYNSDSQQQCNAEESSPGS